MQSRAATVAEYLASLPEDRRIALQAVRKVIKANLDKGFREGMSYGMMGWYVPHSIYPAGYHCNPEQPLPFAGLASQKQAMSLYLMCIYGDSEQRDALIADWKKSGKKLDMGKSCIRFKKLEDLPLDVIGRAVKRASLKKYVASYDASRPDRNRTGAAKPSIPAKKRRQTVGRGTGSRSKAATPKARPR